MDNIGTVIFQRLRMSISPIAILVLNCKTWGGSYESGDGLDGQLSHSEWMSRRGTGFRSGNISLPPRTIAMRFAASRTMSGTYCYYAGKYPHNSSGNKAR